MRARQTRRRGAKLSAYPSSAVVSPHLFQKVGVAGICTA
ncbi:UNVERIFIED_ORG: hypothetical protein ABIC48_004290 [Burkholderia territorii]